MESVLTVLWFGRHLYLQAADGLQCVELPEKGDDVSAIAAAIESVEPRPRTVRVIYQPADLEMHAVDCARGNRSVLKTILSEDHPALRNPMTAWAASRVDETGTGYSTLLWIDAKPRLNRLRATLVARRIDLVGAWPLVTLFETTPPTDLPGQPALAVVLLESGGLVYALTPSGARTVAWTMGAEFRGQIAGLVRNALSHFEANEPPRVLLVDATAEPWDLSTSPLADSSPAIMSLEELLGGTAELSNKSLSNFLPPASRMNANAVLLAASGLCLAAAMIVAAVYVRDYRRMQNDASERQKLSHQLEVSNAHLAANRVKIEKVRALEAEINPAGAGRLQLVSAVMRSTPPEITVHSIAITNHGFEITGTAHEGVGLSHGPFYVFFDALAGKSNPWKIPPETRPTVLPSADFSVNGIFP